jgi:hypothetical protein
MLSDHTRSLSGGLTIGVADGPFLSLGAGHVIRDRSETFSTEQTGPSLAATIGASIESEGRRYQVCPLAGFTQIKVTGDFYGTRATLTQNQQRLGISGGYAIAAGTSVALVPFLTAEYVNFGGTLKGDYVNLPVPDDTFTPVTVGAGLVFRDRVGLTAAVTVPVAPTGTASFVTALSIGLGR